jgi:WD40 repeat protein
MERVPTTIGTTQMKRRTILAGFAGVIGGTLLRPVFAGATSAAPEPRTSPKVGSLQDGSVTVLDTGSLGAVQGIGWSPDSTRLAAFANGGDYNVLLYGADGTLIQTLTGHSNFVQAVAWSADGSLLATGALDGTTRLWSANGEPRGTVGGLGLVAWSPDGKRLATNIDEQAKLWDPAGNLIVGMPDHPDTSAEVTSIAWSPDGTLLAVGTGTNAVGIFHLDGTQVRSLIGHTDFVAALAWTPDGKTIASGSFDGTVRLWAIDGTPITTLRHKGQVDGLAWAPDGATLASDDNQARLWRADGTSITTFGENSSHPVWSPDGTVLAVAKLDTVRLASPDGATLANLRGHTAPVESLAWSPDGKTLASGSRDSTVRLWR